MATSSSIIDLDFARRLERAEGMANVACIEARRAMVPNSQATWTEVAGTLAMFDQPESPLTQTFGLGTSNAISDDDLDHLEQFFGSRGADVHHEVCPLVEPSLQRRLSDRGYHPIEWSNVLRRPLDNGGEWQMPIDPRLRTRKIDVAESEDWASVATLGWSDEPLPAEFMRETFLMLAQRKGSLCFVADWEGTPIATASLFVFDRIALMAGASTIPTARRRGAQRALFAARMKYALDQGCEWAVVVTVPGSTSDRNAQSSGFQNCYTRTKWRLKK
jgi:hypothetical protein